MRNLTSNSHDPSTVVQPSTKRCIDQLGSASFAVVVVVTETMILRMAAAKEKGEQQ